MKITKKYLLFTELLIICDIWKLGIIFAQLFDWDLILNNGSRGWFLHRNLIGAKPFAAGKIQSPI